MTPNQPKTPSRNVRVPDERWQASMAKAQENGTTVTAVVNAALQAYIEGRLELDGL